MNVSEFRSKTVGELQTEKLALLREHFNLRIQKGAGQNPQTHLFRNIKKDIARINTLLREKEGS